MRWRSHVTKSFCTGCISIFNLLRLYEMNKTTRSKKNVDKKFWKYDKKKLGPKHLWSLVILLKKNYDVFDSSIFCQTNLSVIHFMLAWLQIKQHLHAKQANLSCNPIGSRYLLQQIKSHSFFLQEFVYFYFYFY